MHPIYEDIHITPALPIFRYRVGSPYPKGNVRIPKTTIRPPHSHLVDTICRTNLVSQGGGTGVEPSAERSITKNHCRRKGEAPGFETARAWHGKRCDGLSSQKQTGWAMHVRVKCGMNKSAQRASLAGVGWEKHIGLHSSQEKAKIWPRLAHAMATWSRRWR